MWLSPAGQTIETRGYLSPDYCHVGLAKRVCYVYICSFSGSSLTLLSTGHTPATTRIKTTKSINLWNKDVNILCKEVRIYAKLNLKNCSSQPHPTSGSWRQTRKEWEICIVCYRKETCFLLLLLLLFVCFFYAKGNSDLNYITALFVQLRVIPKHLIRFVYLFIYLFFLEI